MTASSSAEADAGALKVNSGQPKIRRDRRPRSRPADRRGPELARRAGGARRPSRVSEARGSSSRRSKAMGPPAFHETPPMQPRRHLQPGATADLSPAIGAPGHVPKSSDRAELEAGQNSLVWKRQNHHGGGGTPKFWTL